MHFECIEGIVLRKTLYTDTKIMVSVFSKTEGLFSLMVPLGKKETYPLGCFESGHVLELEVIRTPARFKLKEVRTLFTPINMRRSLIKIQCFTQLLNQLSSMLPEGSPDPVFYTFLKGSIKAFEETIDPLSLQKFVLLKWLQKEGSLNLVDFPTGEITELLELRQFNQLKSLSQDTILAIDHLIKCV